MKRLTSIFAVAFWALAVLCPRGELSAQSLGSASTIEGTVVDPSGDRRRERYRRNSEPGVAIHANHTDGWPRKVRVRQRSVQQLSHDCDGPRVSNGYSGRVGPVCHSGPGEDQSKDRRG